MTGLKTVENDGDVNEFIESVENPRRREEVAKVVRMMEQVSGEPPRMWGDSIVGFGPVQIQEIRRLGTRLDAHGGFSEEIEPYSLHHAGLQELRRPPRTLGQAQAFRGVPVPDKALKCGFRCVDRARLALGQGHAREV